MKAARWYKAKDIRVEQIEEPQVTAGRVKIQVAWTGICGSDLHEYVAGPIFVPVDAPHAVSNEVAPIVMGHEFSGTVVEVGEGVTGVNIGDLVVVEPILACGKCAACLKGKYNVCKHLGFHGLSGGGGGLSEFTVVDERWVHKMPEGLSLELGATAVINSAEEADVAAKIQELTNGGADVAFEVTGVPIVLQQAIDSTSFEEVSNISSNHCS